MRVYGGYRLDKNNQSKVKGALKKGYRTGILSLRKEKMKTNCKEQPYVIDKMLTKREVYVNTSVRQKEELLKKESRIEILEL